VAVLHTHSRRLDYHPHVHLVMPAAALDALGLMDVLAQKPARDQQIQVSTGLKVNALITLALQSMTLKPIAQRGSNAACAANPEKIFAVTTVR